MACLSDLSLLFDRTRCFLRVYTSTGEDKGVCWHRLVGLDLDEVSDLGKDDHSPAYQLLVMMILQDDVNICQHLWMIHFDFSPGSFGPCTTSAALFPHTGRESIRFAAKIGVSRVLSSAFGIDTCQL